MKKYARVFKYLSSYKGEAALYVVFIVLSIVFSLISLGMLFPFLEMIFNGDKPGVTGLMTNSSNEVVQFVRDFLVDSINTRGKIDTLGIICILIIVSIFFKNLFIYLAYYVLNPLKNKIVNRLRLELYEKVLHLPIGFFTEKRKGDIISRITNDVGEVEGSVVGSLEGWVTNPLTILATLGMLLAISVKLTLFVLLCIPVVGFVIGRITRTLKKGSAEIANLNSDSLSVLDETLTGLRVIKAFNSEPLLKNRYSRINQDLITTKNKVGFRRDLASPASELMGVIIFIAILYYGGQMVLSEQFGLTGSLFIAYLGLFYQLINPTKALSGSFSNMAKGTAAIERIEEILNTKNAIDDNPNGKKLDAFADSIELRNVNFDYDGIPILKNINLKVPKGKTVALVGSSGAGKSTLADLVP
ncbi:MAG TPA: ABC transporter ATP-binding protein, partial [Flavisolibacter sp.]